MTASLCLARRLTLIKKQLELPRFLIPLIPANLSRGAAFGAVLRGLAPGLALFFHFSATCGTMQNSAEKNRGAAFGAVFKGLAPGLALFSHFGAESGAAWFFLYITHLSIPVFHARDS